jgi:phosphatidylserine/phosphatidylglycerophosphate/cardiolipin synthase-like enzyme
MKAGHIPWALREQFIFRLFALPALCFCFLLASAACMQQSAAPLSSFPPRASFTVGFSPKGESLNIILDAVNGAERSILVAAYSFTSKPIATALVAARKRGVAVQVVADARSNSGRYSAVTFLANQGVPVRVNGHYAIFHHKFMVIDGRHLETGSFNYSAAAAGRNAENVLLLRDMPELAGIYAREWEKLWVESEEVNAQY